MQIIIDIPEKQYNTIKSDLYNTFPAEMKKWGLEAIRNGIPLPKGHGRLIDADVLKKYIDDCDCCIECANESYGCAAKCKCPDYLDEDMERIINNQPTIIKADKEVQE